MHKLVVVYYIVINLVGTFKFKHKLEESLINDKLGYK